MIGKGSRRTFVRALVAGGAGFVGSHLCDALVRGGTEVVCVDNLSTGSDENVAHLRSEPRFAMVVQDAESPLNDIGDFDAIFHLASPAAPLDYRRMPIETMRAGSCVTLNLLSIAKRQHARFLLASTSEVYGDPLIHPQPESYWGNVNPIGPRSMYDEAKRFAEALTMAYRRSHGLNSVIVRIFNTYGPRMRGDDGRAVPTFIGQALNGDDLTVAGDGLQTRSLCYVDDTVRGILAAAGTNYPGPFNIGNPDEGTIRAIAEKIKQLAGSTSALSWIDRPEDDPCLRRPDISLAQSMLRWHPQVSTDEGLVATIAWFALRPPHSPDRC